VPTLSPSFSPTSLPSDVHRQPAVSPFFFSIHYFPPFPLSFSFIIHIKRMQNKKEEECREKMKPDSCKRCELQKNKHGKKSPLNLGLIRNLDHQFYLYFCNRKYLVASFEIRIFSRFEASLGYRAICSYFLSH
jgi:hypothetical protein